MIVLIELLTGLGKHPRHLRLLLIKEGKVRMNNRISIDPQICHGQACIKGTRIPVHQIVRMLANGDAIEDLLQEYPSLKQEDILACLDYAASLAEELVSPIEEIEA